MLLATNVAKTPSQKILSKIVKNRSNICSFLSFLLGVLININQSSLEERLTPSVCCYVVMAPSSSLPVYLLNRAVGSNNSTVIIPC